MVFQGVTVPSVLVEGSSCTPEFPTLCAQNFSIFRLLPVRSGQGKEVMSDYKIPVLLLKTSLKFLIN